MKNDCDLVFFLVMLRFYEVEFILPSFFLLTSFLCVLYLGNTQMSRPNVVVKVDAPAMERPASHPQKEIVRTNSPELLYVNWKDGSSLCYIFFINCSNLCK